MSNVIEDLDRLRRTAGDPVLAMVQADAGWTPGTANGDPPDGDVGEYICALESMVVTQAAVAALLRSDRHAAQEQGPRA